MRLPRMTTRRWMIVVAVVGVAVSSAIEIRRHWRLRSRHAVALLGYHSAMKWFDEGRITLEKAVTASERLLEAEFDLSAESGAQALALSAHLDRARQLINRERKETMMICHYDPEKEIAQVEATLAPWKVRLETMRGSRRRSTPHG